MVGSLDVGRLIEGAAAPAVDACARALIDSGDVAGAQWSLRVGDDVALDAAAGVAAPGWPMSARTVMNSYCMTKPLLACCVGHFVDAGALSWSDPLSRFVRGIPDSVTVADVLSHNAGLARPNAVEVMILGRQDRVNLLRGLSPALGGATPRRSYSGFLYGAACKLLFEQLDPQPWHETIAQLVTLPLDMQSTFFAIGSGDVPSIASHLGCHWMVDGGRLAPLLHELLPKYVNDPTLSLIGAHTTSRDLAEFYVALLRGLVGEHVPGMPRPTTLREMTRHRGDASFDEGLGRDSRFGLGLMVDLSDQDFGSHVGRDTLGHLGLFGSSFAFADAGRRLVLVFQTNSFDLANKDSLGRTRRAILDAMYEALLP